MTTPAYRCFEDLIIRHQKDFLNELSNLKIPKEILIFPDFLEQFDTIFEIFGGNIETYKSIIKK